MKKQGKRFSEHDRQLKPMMVEVVDQDRLDAALKKLKRMMKDGKTMIDLQKHEFFRKPSDKKREKRMRAISRNRRAVAEEKGRGL